MVTEARNDGNQNADSDIVTGRVNHRGWIVLLSVANADMSLCVDIFEDPAGGFGFEHFRSDPEDAGRWTPIGGFASTRYDNVCLAAEAALAAVGWVSSDGEARRAITEFRGTSKPKNAPTDSSGIS